MSEADADTGPKIKVDEVSKEFPSPSGRTAALLNVSLAMQPHKVTSIIGPSGCGKSTVLKLIAGFETPDQGRLLVDNTEISGIGSDRVMVFQQPVLFPWMTVRENARFGEHGKNVDVWVRRQCADDMLAEVGLDGFADHYPYQLSGGMKQRLQLARAFSLQPEVLLLDEPFGALDAQTRLKMQELLASLVAHHKPTVLFITHDYDEALFVSDRIYVMSSRPGQIVDSIDLRWSWPRSVALLEEPEFVRLRTKLLKTLYQS